MEFCTGIKVGNNKRSTEGLSLCLMDIRRISKNAWTYHVICSGAISEDRILEANSQFDCIILGLAFLRQALRQLLETNPKLKFYEETEGNLEEITIEDIFWTHDCITDDMEDMITWAKQNGYKQNEL